MYSLILTLLIIFVTCITLLVGQENQSSDHLSHFGIWCRKDSSGLTSRGFKKAQLLEDSLVTNVDCAHERLGLSFVIRDGVECSAECVFAQGEGRKPLRCGKRN